MLVQHSRIHVKPLKMKEEKPVRGVSDFQYTVPTWKRIAYDT